MHNISVFLDSDHVGDKVGVRLVFRFSATRLPSISTAKKPLALRLAILMQNFMPRGHLLNGDSRKIQLEIVWNPNRWTSLCVLFICVLRDISTIIT